MQKIPNGIFKIALVGMGNIVNTVMGFLFFVVVAKILSIEEFGKYALITSLLVGMGKFVDFGTNSIFVAAKEKTDEDQTYFFGAKIILLVIGLILSLATLFLLKSFTLKTMAIFFVGYIFYSVNYTLFGIFQKKEDYIKIFLINFLPALTKLIFAGMLFLDIIEMHFEGLFSVFALSVGMCLIFSKAIDIRQINIKLGLLYIKRSVWAGISQVTNEAFPAITNLLAKFLIGIQNVGPLSLANRISTIFSLASYSIFTVLLPSNAKREKEKSGYDFGETSLIAFLILFLGVLGAFLGTWFIKTFFGNKFVDAVPALHILLASAAITAIYGFLENYFYVKGQANKLGKLAIFRIGFISLTAILMNNYNVLGIAYAHLATSTASLLIMITLIWVDHSKYHNM